MHKPLVSVIVPTRNSSWTLNECLASARRQSYQNIEIIVVDNNSSDNTKEIALKYTDKVFNKGPERSAQRNWGAQRANGNYLLFIDSDMKLSENVVLECVKKIQGNQSLKAVVIPEESFGEGFWVQCKRLERSFYVGVGWMEAARFFRREVFMEMGGYDESNTGTEDYDLPQRIEAKYGSESIGRIDEFIYHDEGRINLIKSCQKKFYYAQKLDSYRSVPANANKFREQSSLLARYKLFFSNPKKLWTNPILGLGLLFMKTCEFTAGSLGYFFGKLEKLQL